jgi:hypothetical protein
MKGSGPGLFVLGALCAGFAACGGGSDSNVSTSPTAQPPAVSGGSPAGGKASSSPTASSPAPSSTPTATGNTPTATTTTPTTTPTTTTGSTPTPPPTMTTGSMTTTPTTPTSTPPPATPPAPAASTGAPPLALALPTAMNIPTTHPRLWWNAERLARAKTWFAAHPFTPKADEPLNQAFHYLLTGNAASARQAISYLMNLSIGTSETSSDSARWYGEIGLLIFDWCHDQLTDAERAALVTRWNGYVNTLDAKVWGGPGMEANNYYWGYLRNAFEWAVASYQENPEAPAILKHALETRWRDSFLPFAAAAGKGGVPQEGSQYGRYILQYPVIPMTTAALLGNDMWNQTAFYKEALFYLIYSSTPAPTATRGMAQSKFEMFPFNDDEFFRQGGTAEDSHYASFLAAAIERWRGSSLAGYAQAWLDLVKPPMDPVDASVFTPATAKPFSGLPLDYFAPGNSYFYTRNRWAPDATLVNLTLGRTTGTGQGGHEHTDWGGFQMWRAGRWLSRESTGYVDPIAGFRGAGTVDCSSEIGHNAAVLFDGAGIKSRAGRKGPPRTLRVESRPDYSFAVVDLSDAYHIVPGERVERDNPLVKSAVREYLFVRPLESLIVLDRLEATNPGTTRTFITHFETSPQIQGASVLDVNGDQAVRVSTLSPAAPAYRVVDEGGPIGQFRLELDGGSGAAQSYFLNVLSARGAQDPEVTAKLVETGDAFEVTLTHPTKGTAKVVLKKGMTSAGGSFGYSAGPVPALAPLTDRVQGTHMSNEGPVWE